MQLRFKTITVAALVVLLSHLVSAQQPKIDSKVDDLKKFDGLWKANSAMKQGEILSDETVKSIKVSIKDGKVAISMNKFEDPFTLTIDPAKKPAEFEFAPVDDPKVKAKGIYLFEGENTLKLCWSVAGADRPKDFSPKADTSTCLLVLARAK